MDSVDVLKGNSPIQSPQISVPTQEQIPPVNEATQVSNDWLRRMSIAKKGAVMAGLGIAGLGALTALGVVSFPVNPVMSVIALGALPGQAYTFFGQMAENFRPIVDGIRNVLVGWSTSPAGAFINPPRR